MVKKADVPKVALDSALSLAATTGWGDLTLRDVSEASGVTLVQLHDVYRSKDAILDAFVRQIDEAVLAGDNADLNDESAKDRLFDVLMRRFDALAPHKAAGGGWYRQFRFDGTPACQGPVAGLPRRHAHMDER
jgi:AcrR family transcriptional regulator